MISNSCALAWQGDLPTIPSGNRIVSWAFGQPVVEHHHPVAQLLLHPPCHLGQLVFDTELAPPVPVNKKGKTKDQEQADKTYLIVGPQNSIDLAIMPPIVTALTLNNYSKLGHCPVKLGNSSWTTPYRLVIIVVIGLD